MKRLLSRTLLAPLMVSLCILALLAGAPQGQAVPAQPLCLGVVESLFQDMPVPVRQAALVPLNSLIQEQTGIPCRPAIIKDAEELGERLEGGKVQVGVLNGYEFAWIQGKYPKLKPLAITLVGKNPRPVVYLVARQESPVSGFEDLRGQHLSLPLRSYAHVRLFLDREAGREEECPFTVCRHPSIEDALDDVVRGKVAAVVVDDAALGSYRQVKPGAYRKLKVVEESPAFPAGVVIYREGGLDPATVGRFYRGLLAAHKNPRNQVLMSLWRLSSFETVPQDYDQALASIRQNYPPPEGLD